MHEELSYGDNLTGTFHQRIITVQEEPMSFGQMEGPTADIERLVEDKDTTLLKKNLLGCADFTPSTDEIYTVTEVKIPMEKRPTVR